MDVRIVLIEPLWECLRQAVSAGSPALRVLDAALEAAPLIEGGASAGSRRVVACDMTNARTLRDIAERDCPAAVGRIDIAINVAKEKADGR